MAKLLSSHWESEEDLEFKLHTGNPNGSSSVPSEVELHKPKPGDGHIGLVHHSGVGLHGHGHGDSRAHEHWETASGFHHNGHSSNSSSNNNSNSKGSHNNNNNNNHHHHLSTNGFNGTSSLEVELPAASAANLAKPRWPGGGWSSMTFSKMAMPALVVATVIVDALAPLLQEQASKVRGFQGSSMVVAETMSYYLGGLFVAILAFGPSGFWRCVRPMRYAAFLPASFAFSSSNFLTYIAVRGLGASQFYLLAQLRIAILAAVQRYRSGIQQPLASWLALVQLATGMVVLVWYKNSDSSSDPPMDCGLPGVPSVSATAVLRAAAAAEAAERAEWVAGIFALLGVVLTSAFGFLYLEWQLKLHAQDPLYVQLHQMNSFGCAVSLILHLNQSVDSKSGPSADPQVQSALASLPTNATQDALTSPSSAAPLASMTVAGGPGFFQIAILLSCIIARGALSGSVLKQLDTIAKGLIDVTAIVLCTCLQIFLDPSTANGTVLGIQMMMLQSIISYQQVRSQGEPHSGKEAPAPAPLPVPSRWSGPKKL